MMLGGGSGYINRRDSISGYTLAGISGKYDKYSTSPISPVFGYEGKSLDTQNLYNKLRGDAGNGNQHGKIVIFESIECES